ncbi:TPA: autotransporter outer membrane beta-barrel domain-containing protein, partial [Salmonella enterica subsp. enterica serovar Litchfield]
MHSWKKKLVVSQLALACTLAITSQANATTYNTFGYHDDATTQYAGINTDTDYVTYGGYVYYNPATTDFDQSFNNDTVNGVISTYYLNNDYTADSTNTLNITNSTIHGMITSQHMWDDTAYVDHDWDDGDTFTLNIANSTIDDDYEYFYFTDDYNNADGKVTTEDWR